MQQPNLLELAKQGEPAAIAALMNAVLSPKGITAQAGLDEDCLWVCLESQKPLNQETLVTFIQKGLLELGNDSIRSVRAQAKKIGEDHFAWTREFSLRSPELSAPVVTAPVAISTLPDAELEASVATLDAPTESQPLVEEATPEVESPVAAAIAEVQPPVVEATPEAQPIIAEAIGEEEELEEPLSLRGWLKTRWRVYAIPVALVVVAGFVAGGTTAFWSTAKSQSQGSQGTASKPPNDAALERQKEAESYLKAMIAAQEKFYQRNNRFARSLEELERSANVISQSYSYAYRLRVGTDSVITAVPREAGLHSYIGVVRVAASGAESLICQSLKPSVQAPEKPAATKGKKTACAARSQKL
ncbi:hypothetical protein H6F51_23380 [Cyanobacteria bacterium FACHB-DQ100]|uniref:type IV pilin-like G/H family protein n=1 Tax=Leptolyngbya sp. DQ-M1 TaxID=2933920 RepID=UPI0019929F58|nr:hypothetical protein [Cyanobacteria bacterium FACHB-DQ100]